MHALTDPLLPWLVTYLLHSTLALGLALLVARFVRSPAARDVLWKGALFGGLVTATLQGFVGRGPEVMTVAPGRALVADTSSGERSVIGIDADVVHALPQTPPVAEASAPRATDVAEPVSASPVGTREARGASLPRSAWLALGWIVVALALTLRLVGRALAMRRLFATRRPLGAPHLRAAAHRLAERRGLVLSESDRIASPVALGRREVCMPARALAELDREEQEAMLAHELAHLERRDPIWLIAAHLLEALFFLQPLNRVVRRRLQDDMEYLCDAWAARRTARPMPLARCLATVAGWLEGERAPALAPGMAATDSRLVQRVEALFDSAPRGGRRVALVATGLALAALACVGPHAETRSAAPERPVVLVQEDGRILAGDGAADAVVDVDELRPWLAALVGRESGATLVINADERASYGDVRRVTDLCDEVGLVAWRLEPHGIAALEGGSGPEIRAVILEEGEDGSEEILVEPPATGDRVVVALSVGGPGIRVHPDGTPWSGKGKYRFDETRKLEYRVGEMTLRSLTDVRIRLLDVIRANPESGVVVAAEAGIVYRDVADLLEEIVRAGFTDVTFAGAYEDPIGEDAAIGVDEGYAMIGDPVLEPVEIEEEPIAPDEPVVDEAVPVADSVNLLSTDGPAGDRRHWLFVEKSGSLRGFGPLEDGREDEYWARVRSTLAALAKTMPTAEPTDSGLVLPKDRLTIHAHPAAPFKGVQKVMEQCGSWDVQIWKIELQRGDGMQAPVIPVYLPLDVGVALEEGSGVEPVERVEVLLKLLADGSMQYSVGPFRSHDLGPVLERVSETVRRRERVSERPETILVDARPGVTTGTVLDLLEPLYADGHTSFSFVGYFEER